MVFLDDFSRDKGAYMKLVEEKGGGVGEGGEWVLQVFQKTLRSPGDHRSKYFMAQ